MKKIIFIFSLFILSNFYSCDRNLNMSNTDLGLFERETSPVFKSPLNIAADPSMIKSNDTLFMYYSAENFRIGVVYSLDNGASWINPNQNQDEDFPALTGQADNWDSTLETVDVIKVDDTYIMYYCGYREDNSDNEHIANYEIGVAFSNDGFNFQRYPESIDSPIIARNVENENTDDRHAMTSPGVVYDDGTYYMIYAGWNVTDNWTGENAGIRILGATSSDGINWTKLDEPLILPTEVPYNPDINEATLLKSDDGIWYIIFSTGSSIGIARAKDFTDKYEVYPKEIMNPEFSWESEITAPDGIIENNTMRIWYHGVKAPLYFPWVIGYAEAEYPLDWE